MLYLGQPEQAERELRELLARSSEEEFLPKSFSRAKFSTTRESPRKLKLCSSRQWNWDGRPTLRILYISWPAFTPHGVKGTRSTHNYSSLRSEVVTDSEAAYWVGGVYALLGENEQALTWLRRAVGLGNHNYPWFQRDKNYDRLRGDPEYQHLLAEVRRHWEHCRELFGTGQ